MSAAEQAFRDAGAFLADALAEDYEEMARMYAENDLTDAHAALLLAARHARKIAERLRLGAGYGWAPRVVEDPPPAPPPPGPDREIVRWPGL